MPENAPKNETQAELEIPHQKPFMLHRQLWLHPEQQLLRKNSYRSPQPYRTLLNCYRKPIAITYQQQYYAQQNLTESCLQPRAITNATTTPQRSFSLPTTTPKLWTTIELLMKPTYCTPFSWHLLLDNLRTVWMNRIESTQIITY